MARIGRARFVGGRGRLSKTRAPSLVPVEFRECRGRRPRSFHTQGRCVCFQCRGFDHLRGACRPHVESLLPPLLPLQGTPRDSGLDRLTVCSSTIPPQRPKCPKAGSDHLSRNSNDTVGRPHFLHTRCPSPFLAHSGSRAVFAITTILPLLHDWVWPLCGCAVHEVSSSIQCAVRVDKRSGGERK
jgi:hypothetical protein